MTYCQSIKDIPSTPHLVILVEKTRIIPADKRSIDYPGHGYPASTERYWDYIVFATVGERNEWIKREEASEYTKLKYSIIDATPRKIVRTVSVV